MTECERKNGVQGLPDTKEMHGTQKEMGHDAPHGKANMSLMKGLTHSESGMILANVFA